MVAGFSDVYEHSSDPLWRQTFFLYVRSLEKQSLHLKMEAISEDEAEENTCIGEAEIKDLSALCDGEVHDLNVDLQG